MHQRNLQLIDRMGDNNVDMVIEQSMAIAADLDVDTDMVYAIAAYQDTGIDGKSQDASYRVGQNCVRVYVDT